MRKMKINNNNPNICIEFHTQTPNQTETWISSETVTWVNFSDAQIINEHQNKRNRNPLIISNTFNAMMALIIHPIANDLR